MKLSFFCTLFVAVLLTMFVFNTINSNGNNNSWDKVFAKSESVKVKKIKFTNRIGIENVGELSVSINIEKKKITAIEIYGQFG